MSDIVIRRATRDDVPVILEFIGELAEYEHMSDQVVATPELLEEWIFERGRAEVLLAELAGKIVALPCSFTIFRPSRAGGIYLEDLFVRPEARGQGTGKALLRELARIALERGCGRLEWACLDWNAPSIAFYRAQGAVPMEEWTTWRLTGESLRHMAGE